MYLDTYVWEIIYNEREPETLTNMRGLKKKKRKFEVYVTF